MSLRADPVGVDRLSIRLRHDTRGAHDAAQRSGFLDALAAGRLPVQAYADLAAQHWFLYGALERAAAMMVDDPVAGAFIVPELTRLPSIEADLDFLHAPRGSDRLTALPATTMYCTRLRDAAVGTASGFLAHHYTRYLGDLSGGQYLGPAIARSYGLTDGGCRFFVFERIDPVAFKAHYRRLLDTVPWSRAEQDAFIAEVAEAYRLTIAMLAELQERWAPDRLNRSERT